MPRIEDYSQDGYIIVSDLFVGDFPGKKITALVSNMTISVDMEKFVDWVKGQSQTAIIDNEDGLTPYTVSGPDGYLIKVHRKWHTRDSQVNIVKVVE
jgi:hypothetical protein